jgi:uncharacterized iron-regulated membrane protein
MPEAYNPAKLADFLGPHVRIMNLGARNILLAGGTLRGRTSKPMSHLPNLLAAAASNGASLGTRDTWLAITVLAAFLVALLAGVLTWVSKRQPSTAISATVIDNRPLAAAVLYAGVAFGGTIGLLMTIYTFIVG